MLVVFVALIVGPIVAGKYISFNDIPMSLKQPTGLKNNDTTNEPTGPNGNFGNPDATATSESGDSAPAATSDTGAAAAAATLEAVRMLRYMAY